MTYVYIHVNMNVYYAQIGEIQTHVHPCVRACIFKTTVQIRTCLNKCMRYSRVSSRNMYASWRSFDATGRFMPETGSSSLTLASLLTCCSSRALDWYWTPDIVLIQDAVPRMRYTVVPWFSYQGWKTDIPMENQRLLIHPLPISIENALSRGDRLWTVGTRLLRHR